MSWEYKLPRCLDQMDKRKLGSKGCDNYDLKQWIREKTREEINLCLQQMVLHIINILMNIMTQGVLGPSINTLMGDFNNPYDRVYRE